MKMWNWEALSSNRSELLNVFIYIYTKGNIFGCVWEREGGFQVSPDAVGQFIFCPVVTRIACNRRIPIALPLPGPE